MDSPLLEARIITNIASAEYLQGEFANADRTATAGLRRASGAAAEWRPYLWGVKAQVAYARGDLPTAARLIERTFAGVDLAHSTMFYRDFHDTARYIYQDLGKDREALAHLAALKRLDDEGREVAASTNSALMSARFDAANQELRITKLKADRAQRDLMLAQSEQRLRTITLTTLIGGGAAAAVMAAVLFAFFSARRSRREVSAANGQLTYAARHDALTGLANRAYFRERLGEELERDEAACAILLIDLDRFKMVNDTLGHSAGDELLREVARRLERIVGDAGHAARLGGDEFAVMVPSTSDGCEALAAHIVAELSEPYDLEQSSVTIGATVGIGVAPSDGDTIDTIIRSADLALYRAKELGRGRYARYEQWMQAEADERRLLEMDLRSALEEDHLSIAYQPIVDATTGETVAFEALLRWNHPTRGLVPPSVFVPIAEEARLINHIGSWVLRTACAEAGSWPENIKLAVNLSVLQVEADGLTSTIVNALASSGLRPNRLELEVTESVFLRQGAKTDATLDRLRSIGVSFALDDFGTGYSSLGYLQRAAETMIAASRPNGGIAASRRASVSAA
jgi:diguanylate cyclase (GGDEF)-like protein